jgi:hypothetical protein
MDNHHPGRQRFPICNSKPINLLDTAKAKGKNAPVRFVHGLEAFRQVLGHVLGSGGASDLLPEL